MYVRVYTHKKLACIYFGLRLLLYVFPIKQEANNGKHRSKKLITTASKQADVQDWYLLFVLFLLWEFINKKRKITSSTTNVVLSHNSQVQTLREKKIISKNTPSFRAVNIV